MSDVSLLVLTVVAIEVALVVGFFVVVGHIAGSVSEFVVESAR
jgi:hypothetical protein